MLMTPNLRAALFITASMTAFTVNDAFMKLASGSLPFFQQIFMRGVMITLGLFVLARLWGHFSVTIAPQDRRLIRWRTLAEAVSTMLFLAALFAMPIANLSAILQALPLTVTLAAAVFLREPVGWRRLVAILIGFAGVMLIVRPGMEGFTVYSLAGLGAAAFITLRDLTARKLSVQVPSSIVALNAAIGVTLLSGLASVVIGEHWVMPNLYEAALLVAAALCLMVGYISAVAGMRGGDIGFVAPFRYTSLLVALILGFMLFDEWPDALTLIGAAVVVVTGLFTIYRDRRAARHAAKANAAGLRAR